MVVNRKSVMVVRAIIFILLVKENLYVYASGYDAYSSCYRKSRKRQDLPCDFGKQTWCNIPGSSYPWHAVRRFVHENQGLMRRMYGDERHLSVLRAELESNDVEYLEGFKDEFRSRYSKDMDGARGFVKIFIGRDARKPAGKLQKSIDEKSNNVLYHNHFKTLKEGDAKAMPTNYPNKTFVRPLTTSRTTVSEPTLKPESITQLSDLLRLNATTAQGAGTLMADLTTQSETGLRGTDPNFNFTMVKSEEMEEELEYSAETEDTMTTTGSETLTTTNEVDFEEEDKDEGYQDVTEDDEEEEEEEAAKEEEPLQRPASPQTPPLIRLKGINACPVKEEVVAPFWANNTRGEVLALLNLYPFEQYVHWEKCTFEHKQMFCREGCRCEQQYRLHRLLAYDPNNECRGIFSDWFRFPSCCVCKCYNIPMEFRLTSRSPRFQTPDIYRRRNLKTFNRANAP